MSMMIIASDRPYRDDEQTLHLRRLHHPPLPGLG